MLIGVSGLNADSNINERGKDEYYQLETIIVTAEKRPNDAQKTPISLTTFTEKLITSTNIDEITDIALRTPGLTIGNNSNTSAPELYIRGVGTRAFSTASDTSIGIYVDDIYISRAGALFFDLFDLEQIEVLRGPQGTLYGRNTIGGAIRITTKKPTNEFHIEERIKVGNFNLFDIAGTISGPITKDIALGRLSYHLRDRDGFNKNIFNEDKLADVDSIASRGTLWLFPTNDISLELGADYQKDRPNAIVYKPEIISNIKNNGTDIGISINDPPFNHVEPSNNFEVNHGSRNTSDKRDIWGVSGKLTWDIDNLTLMSLSSFRKLDIDLIDNPDGIGLSFFDLLLKKEQKQFLQELRLSNKKGTDFKWIAGLFYFREKSAEHAKVLAEDFSLLLGQADFSATNISETKSENFAIFGDLTFSLTDRLNLNLGIRYSYEKKEFELERLNNVIFPSLPKSSDQENWDALTPKIGLQFQQSDDLLWYGIVSRGFKSGGYNSFQTTQPTLQGPFDPEYLTAYEIGVKSMWIDKRLRLNAALFYYEHKDLQVQTFIQNVVEIRNAAKARDFGMEIEIINQFLRRLEISGSIAFLETEYTNFKNSPNKNNPDVSGNALIRAPRFSSNIAVQYTIPILNYGEIKARCEYQYQSRVYLTETNESLLSQAGFNTVNAKLSYITANERLSIAIYGENLTNEEIINVASDFRDDFGTVVRSFSPPRTYGLEITYRY